MDRAHVERMAQALARPEILAHDPPGLTALRRALERDDPPLSAGRRGALVGYAADGPRRRLVELDRRGHLIAACRWREDGGLAWAKCLSAAGDWIGVEPGAGARSGASPPMRPGSRARPSLSSRRWTGSGSSTSRRSRSRRASLRTRAPQCSISSPAS